MVPDLHVLPPGAPFSRAVYELLRPKIPRAAWPSESIKAAFTPSPDGLHLQAQFEGFPTSYALLAAHLVWEAKVKMVMASPCVLEAQQVVKAKRWRDVFMFSLVPTLFAIPLMAALSDTAMRLAVGVFIADVAGLAVFHTTLLGQRARLLSRRFIAEIPVPGLKLGKVAPPSVQPQPLDPGRPV